MIPLTGSAESARGHLTRDGKYHDSEWNGFKNAAINSGEGTDNVERNGGQENAIINSMKLLHS